MVKVLLCCWTAGTVLFSSCCTASVPFCQHSTPCRLLASHCFPRQSSETTCEEASMQLSLHLAHIWSIEMLRHSGCPPLVEMCQVSFPLCHLRQQSQILPLRSSSLCHTALHCALPTPRDTYWAPQEFPEIPLRILKARSHLHASSLRWNWES